MEENIQDRLRYEPEMKILFLKNSINNAYEPIMYNCIKTVDSYEGIKIEKNTLFHDLIKFVRKLSEEIDKNTGEKAIGYFELYQWHIAFCAITCAVRLKSEDMLTAIARQSKYCSV